MSQVPDYKVTRIEAILQVISDELGAEIEREAKEQEEAERAEHYKGIAVGMVPEMK